jgi:site-specific recombinase XerD
MQAILIQYARHLEEEKQLSANSVKAYLYDTRLFLTYLESSLKRHVTIADIIQLDKSDIYLYVNYLQKHRGNNTPAINRKLSSLRLFFDFLIENGMAKHNMAERVHIKRIYVPMLDGVTLEDSAIQQILTNCSSLRNRLLFQLVAIYALTPAEIAQIEAVHIRNDKIHIQGTQSRVVRLDVQFAKDLAEYVASNKAEGEGAVFRTANRQSMTVRTIQNIIKELFECNELKPLTATQLRRNAIDNYMRQNEQGLEALREFLGFKSLISLERYLK